MGVLTPSKKERLLLLYSVIDLQFEEKLPTNDDLKESCLYRYGDQTQLLVI